MAEKIDIAIVGGGIVGTALACCLGNSAFRVALIDNHLPSEFEDLSGRSDFDPRVSALTAATARLLQRVGAWGVMQALRISAYDKMEVWDADGSGHIGFDAAELHEPRLGYIVENRVIVAALNKALKDLANVDCLRPARLGEAAPLEQEGSLVHELRLEDGRCLQANLLIGADGGNSWVRKHFDFPLRSWDYGHEAIVTTVRSALPHGKSARQVFLPEGPLAFLPLKKDEQDDGRYCSIVWSCVPEKAQDLMAMTDEAFARALEEAFESRLGGIEQVDKRYSFPLRQRHAKDYVKAGVALVGDAAHTIHPLAGQGVNLGLQDVRVLAEVLLAARERGEDFSAEQVLSRYQRRRKGDNLSMMGLMEGFKRLFASDDLALRWVRNWGMTQVDGFRPLKHFLMARAMGLNVKD